jgi:phosphotransferase system HPr (HPr) family protein
MRLTRRLTVRNGTGLHARPAARFADTARGFAADVVVEHGDRSASAKSLIALLRLGVGAGGSIAVHAEGEDAALALDRLAALLDELAAEDVA